MNTERVLSHCALEVRRHDYDRFLCAMYAKPAARNRLFSLYAFNLELARIADLVSEPALGEIRLQWWRDALDGVYRNSPRDHPVTLALVATGAAHVASRASIEALIDARARDLDNAPMPNLNALVAYAEGTSSTLLSLAMDLLEISDESARAVAIPLGRAWALTGIIRATGYFAARQRCFLPADVLAQLGLTVDEIQRGANNSALRKVISEVASLAERDIAAIGRGNSPRIAQPVTLMATLTRAYLRRLRRAAYDPYDARLVMSPLARQLALLIRAVANRP